MFGLFSPAPFTPEKDIPDLSGKVIIITGANGGLGYESLIHLARHNPSTVYLCARTRAKYDQALSTATPRIGTASATKIQFLELDLASLSSVARAAQTFLSAESRLDILMNNAGIMAQPPGLTSDGYELQFGTNHMGHFLFTQRLLPLLQKTAAEPGADVRIVNLTSMGHNFAPTGGFAPGKAVTDMKEYNTFTRYGQSKLANILFTTELARRYPRITSVSIHPGGVATGLSEPFMEAHPWLARALTPVRSLGLKGAEEGAWNQTWAAVAPLESGAGKKGLRQAEYYVPVAQVGGRSGYAKDGKLAESLWGWSEEEVKRHGF